jgi:cell division septum initiation protein DivIVA
VSDTMKGRVRGLLGGPSSVQEAEAVPQQQQEIPSDTVSAQHQALQVLNLAQRTAEEHVASARRQADKITADARASAEQIVRDAQGHAQGLQQEAKKALSEAHVTAQQIAREAQAKADSVRQNAEEVVAEAQTKADETVKAAQANADELKHQAEQRYEDVVGGLAAKREALQRQIEALEVFDRDYRTRISTFLQNQLRSLWVEEPKVGPEEIDQPAPADTKAKG